LDNVLLNGILGALHNFSTAELWVAIAIGCAVGLVFGIIPGISGLLALSLMMPFVFKLTPVQALPMMVSALGVLFFGGAVSAILVNLPGTPGSAATLIDGFPMSQKGEAGRAIGAAEASSAMANIMTTVVALILIPLMLRIVMAITSADMVFLMLLGITFIAVLSSGSMIKGLVSGGMGLLIAFVGYQPTTGIERFTFGNLYLYDGIPLIPLVLGLFGVSEMLALAISGGSISRKTAITLGWHDVRRGIKDAFSNWPLVIRSQFIGFFVGMIPGLGGSTATFVAYGQAKFTSKHPEKFGTGTVEGVIAPESANNACETGALLTTVSLGIPGSGIMALLIGAMLMLGLTPGPEMLTVHLDLSLTLIWIMAITGVIGAVICLPLAPQLAKIAYIPGRVLIPLVLMIAFVGAFASAERFEDVIMLVFFSAIGVLMKRFDFNRPAFFLAFILGSLFEKYFFIALKTAGPLFFMRPISLILIAITISMFAFGPTKRWFQRRRGANQP